MLMSCKLLKRMTRLVTSRCPKLTQLRSSNIWSNWSMKWVRRLLAYRARTPLSNNNSWSWDTHVTLTYSTSSMASKCLPSTSWSRSTVLTRKKQFLTLLNRWTWRLKNANSCKMMPASSTKRRRRSWLSWLSLLALWQLTLEVSLKSNNWLS